LLGGKQKEASNCSSFSTRKGDLALDYVFTEHVENRMSKRGISVFDIYYSINYGKKYYRAGAVHFVLRRKDIPVKDQNNQSIQKLEGLTVLLGSKSKEIVTAYINKAAPRAIKKKKKYDNRK
jgi:hypothetical protein